MKFIKEEKLLSKMKQTPETLDILIAFLGETMDIRERERGFYALPADEQTSKAQKALRADLKARVVALSEQYSARLEGTPERSYLKRLAGEYAPVPMDVEGFIDMYKLSTRTANILFNLKYGSKNAGIQEIKNPEDLLKYTAKQLLRVKGLGTTTLHELDNAFQEEGWKIKGIERYREMQQKKYK